MLKRRFLEMGGIGSHIKPTIPKYLGLENGRRYLGGGGIGRGGIIIISNYATIQHQKYQ